MNQIDENHSISPDRFNLIPRGLMLFSHGSMAFGENEGSFIWWRSENGSLSVYYQVSSILLFKDKIKIKICSELRIPI